MQREDLGDRLFTFAVITDTHLNPGEDDCNSPFEVNKLANARMRHVVRDLNARDLAFVVNVGDLIHPVPAVPHLYEQAAARFHEQVAELRHELHLTPGNHDVGDKPNAWAPAAIVAEPYLELWEKHFGPQFHAFDHDGCRFIIINAQIINSGFPVEEEQRAWLEGELQTHAGKRIFLHSHYPPYFVTPDEEANYDNIDEPGRSWMLGLLDRHDVEALFIGHVHNFWYNKYSETDCYLLPSTAFVRQDYSEMYRAAPGPDDEAGRNDRPKLGYFLVHVHEGGHVCEVVRTYGAVAGPDAAVEPMAQYVAPVHPRLNAHASLGFDMRQNWMELVEIPPTGGLDEFDRKEVRNDYPLMALWEMGVRKLRVPLRDLMRADARDRMRILRGQGHEFTLFSFGLPDANTQKLILDHQDIFVAWELCVNWEVLKDVADGIGEIAGAVDMPVYFSRLRSIEELRTEAGQYYHAINQGFLPGDFEQMKGLLARDDFGAALGGFVFRLTDEMHPWTAIQAAADLAAEMGVGASVHLRMFGANPAAATCDDQWAANRVAEAIAAAVVAANVSVYVDTLADNDRGYFVRNGVIDRLFNPRLGFHVVKNFHGALAACGEFTAGSQEELGGARLVTLETGAEMRVLVLPQGPLSAVTLPANVGSRDSVEGIDLATGRIHAFSATSPGALTVRSDTLPTLTAPTLIGLS